MPPAAVWTLILFLTRFFSPFLSPPSLRSPFFLSFFPLFLPHSLSLSLPYSLRLSLSPCSLSFYSFSFPSLFQAGKRKFQVDGTLFPSEVVISLPFVKKIESFFSTESGIESSDLTECEFSSFAFSFSFSLSFSLSLFLSLFLSFSHSLFLFDRMSFFV
jgi:hypothetical protein